MTMYESGGNSALAKSTAALVQGAFFAGRNLTHAFPSRLGTTKNWRNKFERDLDNNDLARWQSGHAEDCKSLYVGSIPARASSIWIHDRNGHALHA